MSAPLDPPAALQAALQAALPRVSLRLQPVEDTRVSLWLLDEAEALAPVRGDDARRVAAQPPYWSLCWAAGAALASLFHEAPAWVAGRHVVDFGAGSGVVGIAAARAGAARVTLVDADPVAREACAANAAANRVAVEIVAGLDDFGHDADLITVADVFYDPANLPLLPLLQARARRLLVADARRADLADRGLKALGERRARTVPDFGDSQFERVRLFAAP